MSVQNQGNMPYKLAAFVNSKIKKYRTRRDLNWSLFDFESDALYLRHAFTYISI